MESTKSINVCYAKHISWALLGEDLFIFNEITDNTYLFRGLYKEFWLAIQNNNNLKKTSETTSFWGFSLPLNSVSVAAKG